MDTSQPLQCKTKRVAFEGQMLPSDLHDSTPGEVRGGLHQRLQLGQAPVCEYSSAVLQLGYTYKNLSSFAKRRQLLRF